MISSKRIKTVFLSTSLIFGFTLDVALADFVGIPAVNRQSPTSLNVSWENSNPVNLYVTDAPSGTIANARLLATETNSHSMTVDDDGVKRQYFILVDARTNQTLRTAERLAPLETGSNFRDIGGYEGFGGRHIKWGLIYRSGGTPLLSDSDLAEVSQLGLKSVVDLRSDDERVIAPTRILGVNYNAYGYSFRQINVRRTSQSAGNGSEVYRNFPTLLAPQLRIIFAELLGDEAPLAYNCTAGQDRTGFVTAMVLSALGVSHDKIIQDYHLSTRYRIPANEMPRIDLARYPDNPTAQMFARYQNMANANVPQPLVDAQGQAFLEGAFNEIATNWGSVDNYLNREIGLDAAKLARLRQMYLE